MNISNQDIRATISPLRLVFWGGLICVFDFTFSQTVNGEGWKFDIINDLVGMLMITWSVVQLGKIELHDRYRIAMNFVTIVATLSCLDALQAHFIYDTPTFVSFLLSVLGVLAMLATVVFCIAMQWLCREADLQRSERSWRTTTLLFIFIYLIPLGLFYGAAAIAIITEASFNINLGPLGLLLMPVFCIPLIHLFVSTSRMRSDVELNASMVQQDGGGQPTIRPESK
ncbi:MAG: quinol-cytochrome oxidoreductase complex cytochrome b subunit [Rubritalea sp.]|jgi:quinol-cytochrome oxidoreductase complex cytochrome b subunit